LRAVLAQVVSVVPVRVVVVPGAAVAKAGRVVRGSIVQKTVTPALPATADREATWETTGAMADQERQVSEVVRPTVGLVVRVVSVAHNKPSLGLNLLVSRFPFLLPYTAPWVVWLVAAAQPAPVAKVVWSSIRAMAEMAGPVVPSALRAPPAGMRETVLPVRTPVLAPISLAAVAVAPAVVVAAVPRAAAGVVVAVVAAAVAAITRSVPGTRAATDGQAVLAAVVVTAAAVVPAVSVVRVAVPLRSLPKVDWLAMRACSRKAAMEAPVSRAPTVLVAVTAWLQMLVEPARLEVLALLRPQVPQILVALVEREVKAAMRLVPMLQVVAAAVVVAAERAAPAERAEPVVTEQAEPVVRSNWSVRYSMPVTPALTPAVAAGQIPVPMVA